MHPVIAIADAQGRIDTMWEKLRVIFKIPELRRKIFLTLLLLAIYRVGFQIPLPIVDHAKAVASSAKQKGGVGDMLEAVAMFSASQLERGHDLRPGHHALHLGLDHLPAPGQRLAAARTAAEGRRERPQEDQRIHPLRHRRSCAWSKAGSTSSRSSSRKDLVAAEFLNAAGGTAFGTGRSSPC